MASQTRFIDLPPQRFGAHLSAQAGGSTAVDKTVDNPSWFVTARSPYAQDPFDQQSIASQAGASTERVAAPHTADLQEPSRPVILPTVDRFNADISARGQANLFGRSVQSSALPTAHISGRALVLAGAETLTHGLLRGNKSSTITGGLLLAGGVGAATAAIGAAQATLRAADAKHPLWFGLISLAGLAVLGAGGFMRHYADFHDHDVMAIAAMVALAVGAAESALTGAIAFAAAERVRNIPPSQRRASTALWVLDAGVVTTMTYGLATRLNRFPPLVDSAILGAAYTATFAGIVWQYADGAWFKRANVDVSPHLRTTWAPTALIALTFFSKIMVLIGIKLAVDGFVKDNVAFNASGTLVSIFSFVTVCVPQLSYFHPDLRSSGHARAWPVTLAVIAGAVMLAGGSGLREWAALHHNLPLARGAMALAGIGALSVVACSSLSLAASEIERGRIPMRNRPEVALGLQTVGLAIGVAYGLGIRINKFNPFIDDAMLAVSYFITGMGSTMSYASSQLDRATYHYLQEDVPLRVVR